MSSRGLKLLPKAFGCEEIRRLGVKCQGSVIWRVVRFDRAKNNQMSRARSGVTRPLGFRWRRLIGRSHSFWSDALVVEGVQSTTMTAWLHRAVDPESKIQTLFYFLFCSFLGVSINSFVKYFLEGPFFWFYFTLISFPKL